MDNYDGFSKNLLGILRYPSALCHTAEVFRLISTGIKTNHTHKGIDKHVMLLLSLNV